MTTALNLSSTDAIRQQIRAQYLADEVELIGQLAASSGLTPEQREAVSTTAAALIQWVRDHSQPSIMEGFLAEYGLTTKEGVALMCLAEALLRVPDQTTLIALIEDKIGTGEWREHIGNSDSALINTTTWGLIVAGKLFSPFDERGLWETLRALVRRLGDPLVRVVARRAMKEMGRQFVLGRSITEAQKNARDNEAEGYFYSYDMLGEAARTESDSLAYFESYADAINRLSSSCRSSDTRENPGISVKLSALHPRYECGQRDRVMKELVPRARALAQKAKAANMGFNIDAEEADRLDLSLDVIEAVLDDPSLAGWNGFGVVVQAYGQRATFVLNWLYALAERLDRKIMVRLVKGAYWDAEIKRAQVMGLSGFPVFTRKVCSDVSYIVCAEKLLAMTDRIYPQFATHNAHSVSAVLNLAGDETNFEFQRLHGMGESLYEAVLAEHPARCRIYAPVGAHKDLLAYLVRRLLENGANSSFVNQIVDKRISPETIAIDPFELMVGIQEGVSSTNILQPNALFGLERVNSRGWDVTDPTTVAAVDVERDKFRRHQWRAGPMIVGTPTGGDPVDIINPANPSDTVGTVVQATAQDVDTAITAAVAAQPEWSGLTAEERSNILLQAVDLFETHASELFALATREAGKTLLDGIAEIREAVDFGRYYANEGWYNIEYAEPVGTVACISPWNFPLAIFAGQIFANLAAGNAVVAKPAPQTPLIAARAVELMYEAGIPEGIVQLLPGAGDVGQALSEDPRIQGLCFTGSTRTAQAINAAMAENGAPDAFLVAETGGLNAMIVDSTALPEQVVRDVIASAFQSAGQRCSALRVLFLQEDIAEQLTEMLFGAMDELRLGDPWSLATDVGPVIDDAARERLDNYIAERREEGRVIKALKIPNEGRFVPPTVVRLDSINQLEEEMFGPVLHLVTFKADELDNVIDAINGRGFGLTFGLHSRVDTRVQYLSERIEVGNTYVNRNQIGAIVGSQPFGGEGLSGTGPKAGGPHYVRRMMRSQEMQYATEAPEADEVSLEELQAAIEQVRDMAVPEPEDRFERLMMITNMPFEPLDLVPQELPGPTGERNVLSFRARGTIVCAGPTPGLALSQALAALSQGNRVVIVTPGSEIGAAAIEDAGLPVVAVAGQLSPRTLEHLKGFAAVACNGDTDMLRACRRALARRSGPITPLITEYDCPGRFVSERHVCTDTTAAGGNASLIAASE